MATRTARASRTFFDTTDGASIAPVQIFKRSCCYSTDTLQQLIDLLYRVEQVGLKLLELLSRLQITYSVY